MSNSHSLEEKSTRIIINIINNREEAYEKYAGLVNSASKEIALLMPSSINDVAANISLTWLQEAAKRGVKVRLLTTAATTANKTMPLLLQQQQQAGTNGIDIRQLYNVDALEVPEILIADNQAWLGYGITKDNNLNSMDIDGSNGNINRQGPALSIIIYSSSLAIAKPLLAMFDILWDQAGMHNKFMEADRMKDEYILKLRELYDKLRQADRLKDEFINIAAHELRTPIMPILGGLELIQSKINKQDRVSGLISSKELREELAIIKRNAERLLKLSEDILQASRIETGRLKLYIEQVNLNMLISEVITDVEKKYLQTRRLAPAAPEKADLRSLIMYLVGEKTPSSADGPRKIISFNPGESNIMVECDRSKIGEVLFNILDNAMKFTDSEQNGSVQVSTRLSGPNVIVSVRDNGKGIDPSIKDNMFEKFTTRSEKGSGLGLYISKMIVQAHHGSIWAGNNSDGRGATFEFSLPLHFRRYEQAAPPAAANATTDQHQQLLLPKIADNQRTIDQLRKEAMERIDNIKLNLIQARSEAIYKTNEALERFQKKVDESRSLIRARQEFINQQINYKRMRREVDSRIEKGLEGLQRLIEGLRENIIGDETVEKIELHPTVSEIIKYEAGKVIESEFFISIKQQLLLLLDKDDHHGGGRRRDDDDNNNVMATNDNRSGKT